jgi:hypothetical protein
MVEYMCCLLAKRFALAAVMAMRAAADDSQTRGAKYVARIGG